MHHSHVDQPYMRVSTLLPLLLFFRSLLDPSRKCRGPWTAVMNPRHRSCTLLADTRNIFGSRYNRASTSCTRAASAVLDVRPLLADSLQQLRRRSRQSQYWCQASAAIRYPASSKSKQTYWVTGYAVAACSSLVAVNRRNTKLHHAGPPRSF